MPSSLREARPLGFELVGLVVLPGYGMPLASLSVVALFVKGAPQVFEMSVQFIHGRPIVFLGIVVMYVAVGRQPMKKCLILSVVSLGM